MPVGRNLGKRCKYADNCSLFKGIRIPENMTKSVWRNVFCNRGEKGWANCTEYEQFEKDSST
jgi:hypothetical protein